MKIPYLHNMPKLIEKTVQKHALNYLYRRYKIRHPTRRIFTRMEVSTKKEYGRKRADGFVCFKTIWGIHVVSMEAKSYKTIAAMKTKFNFWLYLKNCIVAGLGFTVVTGAIYALVKMSDGNMQFLYPLWMFCAGAVLYGVFTVNNYRHKTISVVKQVNQYPANEQWLAFSNDSIKDLKNDKLKDLETICRVQGLGVIVVNSWGMADVWFKPKRHRKPIGDFLKYYSVEKEVRAFID